VFKIDRKAPAATTSILAEIGYLGVHFSHGGYSYLFEE
jgi:hypothetical protein